MIWGDMRLCAGQTPLLAATGELVGEDVGEQTRQSLRNLQAVCEAAGTHLDNALRLTVYVTDLGRFGEVNQAYVEFFGSEPPARTTVRVSALPKGAQVEIDALVALPSAHGVAAYRSLGLPKVSDCGLQALLGGSARRRA